MAIPASVSSLLAPAVALILWTFVMEVWMYITRISAIQKYKIVFDPLKDDKSDFNKHIPARTRWKADNFNHLHEQPTLFYAVISVLAIAVASDPVAVHTNQTSTVTLAWIYVVIRIIHSFWQSLINHIPTRFVIFTSSSFILLLLSFNAARLVF